MNIDELLKISCKFYKLASKVNIFLDFDDTIAHLFQGVEEHLPHDVEHFKMSDGNIILKRPGLDSFLKQIKSQFKLYICSHGKNDYILEALHVMGLLDYFDGIFGREIIWSDMDPQLPAGDFILIDNLPKLSPHSVKKLKFLSADEIPLDNLNYIKVSAFTGKEKENIFPQVMKRIEEIMSRPLE
jgi:hypothetical protein